MEQSKTCTKCGQIKPLSEFYQRSKNPVKYMATCKVCKNLSDLQYQKTYIPKSTSKRGMQKWDRSTRQCVTCFSDYQPATKWQKTCSYACGYSFQNDKIPKQINSKQCARCGQPLSGKKSHAIYCSRTCKSMDYNFTRTRNGGGQIPTTRRNAIVIRDESICYLCKRLVKPQDIELDHLVPYSRGGSARPSNLAVTCKNCNRTRGNRIGIEQLHRLLELRESDDY